MFQDKFHGAMAQAAVAIIEDIFGFWRELGAQKSIARRQRKHNHYGEDWKKYFVFCGGWV